MTNTTIVVASDHRGFALKTEIIKHLKTIGVKTIDCGTSSETPKVDYPKYAQTVAQSILTKKANYGILICGTGIGMSIAANRFKGIRAALCYNKEYATAAKTHNDANIIIFGADYITPQEALECIKVLLEATPDSKYANRIKMLDEL